MGFIQVEIIISTYPFQGIFIFPCKAFQFLYSSIEVIFRLNFFLLILMTKFDLRGYRSAVRKNLLREYIQLNCLIFYKICIKVQIWSSIAQYRPIFCINSFLEIIIRIMHDLIAPIYNLLIRTAILILIILSKVLQIIIIHSNLFLAPFILMYAFAPVRNWHLSVINI